VRIGVAAPRPDARAVAESPGADAEADVRGSPAAEKFPSARRAHAEPIAGTGGSAQPRPPALPAPQITPAAARFPGSSWNAADVPTALRLARLRVKRLRLKTSVPPLPALPGAGTMSAAPAGIHESRDRICAHRHSPTLWKNRPNSQNQGGPERPHVCLRGNWGASAHPCPQQTSLLRERGANHLAAPLTKHTPSGFHRQLPKLRRFAFILRSSPSVLSIAIGTAVFAHHSPKTAALPSPAVPPPQAACRQACARSTAGWPDLTWPEPARCAAGKLRRETSSGEAISQSHPGSHGGIKVMPAAKPNREV